MCSSDSHESPTRTIAPGDWSQPKLTENLHRWVDEAPKLTSSWESLEHIYRRSLVDLAALRFRSPMLLRSMPAAGLPWFMAIFGRDSLLTSFQALPFLPELARTSLQVLAAMQGKVVDGFRDEEP